MTDKATTQRNKRAKAKPTAHIPVPAIIPSEPRYVRNGKPTDEDIRLRAYEKWEAAGRPNGDGIQFWLQAEQELLQIS